MYKKNLTESVLKYLKATSPSPLNEATYKMKKNMWGFGIIEIIDRTNTLNQFKDGSNIDERIFGAIEVQLKNEFYRLGNRIAFDNITLNISKNRVFDSIVFETDRMTVEDLSMYTSTSEKEIIDMGMDNMDIHHCKFIGNNRGIVTLEIPSIKNRSDLRRLEKGFNSRYSDILPNLNYYFKRHKIFESL